MSERTNSYQETKAYQEENANDKTTSCQETKAYQKDKISRKTSCQEDKNDEKVKPYWETKTYQEDKGDDKTNCQEDKNDGKTTSYQEINSYPAQNRNAKAKTRWKMGKVWCAMAVAGAIHFVIFLVLSDLNRCDLSQNRRPPDSTKIFTLDMPTRHESEPTDRSPLPDTQKEPEIMTIDMDFPLSEPMPPEPIEFEVPMPYIPQPVMPERITTLKQIDSSLPAVPVASIQPKSNATKRSTGDAGKRSAAKEDSRSFSPRSANYVDTPPKELSSLPPRYPKTPLHQGIEGYVVAKLLLDENGVVEDVQILEVHGHESFRQAVLDVVAKWKFSPASHQGRPVKVWAIKRIRFELEK